MWCVKRRLAFKVIKYLDMLGVRIIIPFYSVGITLLETLRHKLVVYEISINRGAS